MGIIKPVSHGQDVAGFDVQNDRRSVGDTAPSPNIAPPRRLAKGRASFLQYIRLLSQQ